MVTEEKPIVRMTADSMEAYVMLITPDDGGEYTIESLQKALDDRGVKYGIDEAALTELIDEKKYGVETLVAQGTEPVDGKDGYYCFHAGTKLTDKGIVTNGGRVLGVTAKGADLKEARANAYAATEWVNFKNKYMRHDIGKAIDEA